MSTIKESSKGNILNISIVENHNEVVPFIHREIGRKRIRFDHNTLLHFDSHPDLLIPKDLEAEAIFKKSILYENLSIENWIMPLVYAGHISTVVWVKPSWAEQIQEGKYDMVVGQDLKTKTIRCDCSLEYFVSELLYQEKSLLTDSKDFTLFVIELRNLVSLLTNTQDMTSTCTQRDQSYQPVQDDRRQRSGVESSTLGTQDADKSSNLLLQSASSPTENTYNPVTALSAAVGENHQLLSVNKQTQEGDKNKTCKHKLTASVSCKHKLTASVSCKESQCKQSKLHLVPQSHACHPPGDDFELQLRRWQTDLLHQLHEHVLLDVDLDFFSTKDPFKEEFTPEQYRLLKDVYKFTPPKDDSQQGLQECIMSRQAQLLQNKEILERVAVAGKDSVHETERRADSVHETEGGTDSVHETEGGTDSVHETEGGTDSIHETEGGKDQMQRLIASLPDTTDWLQVHEVGSGIDSTDLPHHISTDDEIRIMLGWMSLCLQCIPYKPKLITISRSSEDSYCPEDQVDRIQDQLLRRLKTLYSNIHVHDCVTA